MLKPASAFGPFGLWGQQIRCDSGADGIVRMKENGTNAGLPASVTHLPGRRRYSRHFP